ncbi:hypothetical protein GALL_497500 [mine drainage metagenome]|uniref:Uncharacterized protein n=1 Tax=mine drainage metagenome TaxID=410659 RepID=A0A1J5PD24_9ZZZZ
MMEESKTERGKAICTLVAEAYIISSTITYHSKPLPIRSSMYLNKNNINNTNITIRKVTKKGLMNDLRIKRCIFFIRMTCFAGPGTHNNVRFYLTV